ncbi:MAG: hypothetical protein KME13_08285 [Myxacorys californica WJT36-NPBG1]|jgi:hypothetical protein|nr:hypothetical protein [Myxacorys californica WJT36-NPBG1]
MYTTQKTFKSSRQVITVALTGLLLISSAAVSRQSALSAPLKAEVAQQSLQLPQSVEQKVRQDLAQRLNVPVQDLKIASFSRETWPDGCLGLGGPAEGCLLAQVAGWRVEVTDGQQTWVYRTDKTANALRLEPQSNTVVLPSAVRQRLIRRVAREIRIPASRLRIAEVKSAVWDGCLGIFKPGQACTRIALQGWQAILTGGDRSWVYHLDQSGSRIAQNPTASGSRGGLVPSFIPEQNIIPTLEPNVIFQSTISGDLSGKVTQTSLTADGVITRLVTAPNIRSRPVVLKRLTEQQVQQFQQVLQNQRFSNLNALRYLSSAAFADYPTTTLQAMGSTVQYIDLEKDNLPEALRQVIQSWEKQEK